MNIQISSNRKLVNVNYDNLVQGKITIPEISIELFLSHCTKEKFDDNKLDPQHNCVKRLSEILINHHKLRTFFDRNDIKSNPGNIINDALDRSRILVAICTPEYIAQFMKQRISNLVERGFLVSPDFFESGFDEKKFLVLAEDSFSKEKPLLLTKTLL